MITRCSHSSLIVQTMKSPLSTKNFPRSTVILNFSSHTLLQELSAFTLHTPTRLRHSRRKSFHAWRCAGALFASFDVLACDNNQTLFGYANCKSFIPLPAHKTVHMFFLIKTNFSTHHYSFIANFTPTDRNAHVTFAIESVTALLVLLHSHTGLVIHPATAQQNTLTLATVAQTHTQSSTLTPTSTDTAENKRSKGAMEKESSEKHGLSYNTNENESASQSSADISNADDSSIDPHPSKRHKHKRLRGNTPNNHENAFSSTQQNIHTSDVQSLDSVLHLDTQIDLPKASEFLYHDKIDVKCLPSFDEVICPHFSHKNSGLSHIGIPATSDTTLSPEEFARTGLTPAEKELISHIRAIIARCMQEVRNHSQFVMALLVHDSFVLSQNSNHGSGNVKPSVEQI